MNNTPKISIIVPVYNVEKYISKCIDSVLSQTFKDWELILVNDGSTDNSGKICDEYGLKDNRIKVIHKENEGVTATRDRGVKEAQGEFLFFIDGDDYITDNALELLINKQKENDADVLKGAMCKIDSFGKRIGILSYDKGAKIISGNNFIYYILSTYFWCLAGTLIRRNILENIFIPTITSGEDLIYMLQIAQKSKICYITNEIIYYYVIHECSRTNSDRKEKGIVEKNRIYISYNLRELYGLYNFNKFDRYAILLLIAELYNNIKYAKGVELTISKSLNKFLYKKFIFNIIMHIKFLTDKKLRRYCTHYSKSSYLKLLCNTLKNIYYYDKIPIRKIIQYQ